MSAKGAPRTAECDRADAQNRFVDAQDFLVTAEVADNHDVRATNAVHAAIAAADVLCCVALRRRSKSTSHADAIELLRSIDAPLANLLRRCLDLKTRAAYEARDVSSSDADRAVERARTLVAHAETELLKASDQN